MHDRAWGFQEPLSETRSAQNRLRLRILQDGDEPVGRVGWIQRHIGTACLPNRQRADHHLWRSRHTQPYWNILAHAQHAQRARQAVCLLVHAPVSQKPRLRTHGGRIRCLYHLRDHRLRNSRVSRDGRTKGCHHGTPFHGIEFESLSSTSNNTTASPYARSGTPPGSFQERNVPYVHHGYEVFRLPRRGTCRGPVVVCAWPGPKPCPGPARSVAISFACSDLLRMPNNILRVNLPV